MQNKEKKIREPLFHVSKRSSMPLWQSSAIRVASIVLALLLCGVLVAVFLRESPIDFYSSLVKGSFGSQRKLWKLFKDIAILLCISVAVTPAFRMKFWNIGAEGQVLVGALASAACMYYLGGKIPEAALIALMFVSSVAAGAVWGLIPAICKALWNTNETLFTLMMNYVATFSVAYFLIKWTPDGSSSLGILEHGHLPKLFDNEYILLIIVVILLTLGMYVYLNYSKHGYEISVVGESNKTACYIGIDVKKIIIRTMLVSGAVCGVAGFLIVGALDHSITTETVGGLGFTAIMVSWLAKFNPLVMFITSFLIVFLNQGASQVSQTFDISSAFPNVVVGIILFFIIGCEFFINYQINFRSEKEGK